MSDTFHSLVSTQWLEDHLGTPGLLVLDASRHLPQTGRDPSAEYKSSHVPGALFLDLESLVDTTSDVPQALPSPTQLAQRLAELGVDPNDRIVLYDDSAVKSSARAWFTLVAHGIEAVAILDGGLAKWREEERPLEGGATEPTTVECCTLPVADRVRTKADLLAQLGAPTEQILDARSADRVFGTGTDPVHGGDNGRIPGTLNLPFGAVFKPDGTYKDADELRQAFANAGVDLSRPVVTTCGSGLTASVLLFALHLIGHDNSALYDGSWMEWSADPDTPKEQGPA
ncbi:MAG: sulfurtransferase [Pseudomonadota bacterium]